jgi:nucleotide-binding universal stress UspA family protein/hemerythrin-like domain-containing protein
MYRHLLVPVDDTDLSVEVVGNAVALARPLGARITFFHAVADASASLRGDAEVLRLTARDEYEYKHLGKARELLTKAEAAARALGVPCESRHAVSDKPAQAIVEAARAGGCDLIFMASHGGRGKLGMAFASETLAVLMNAGLPVLVSSTGGLTVSARAIGIIRDEHRSLAAVMHAWMHALSVARDAGSAADVALMRAILRYVQQFPMKLHHPKEEEHLFRRLRERTTSCNAELDELERQHERDNQLVTALAQQIEALATADAEGQLSAMRALDEEVARYAAFMWDHMGREEGVILPAAQRHLLPEDWAAIDAAFTENSDPNFRSDTDKEYRQLFSRIVNLLPG